MLNITNPLNNYDNSKKHFVEELKMNVIDEDESKMLKKLYEKNTSLDAFIFGDDIPINKISAIIDKSGGTVYYFDQPLCPFKYVSKV